MEYFCEIPSPVGTLTVAGNGDAISGLWIGGQKHFAATLEENARKQNLPVFDDARKWLAVYFSGKDPGLTPPLLPRGTPFQRAVWTLLGTIPWGRAATYGELARRYGEEHSCFSSPRAVGGAVGRNPISLLIPCHRVIGSKGGLTGYAGGLEAKQKLLRLEGVKL